MGGGGAGRVPASRQPRPAFWDGRCRDRDARGTGPAPGPVQGPVWPAAVAMAMAS